MDFMSKPAVLKSISILAFAVSALFTIQLMTSGTVGIWAWILTALMAIVFEVTKCGFFYKSFVDSELNLILRFALGTIAIALVGASIFASAGYVTNQANASKNLSIRSSTQYKQAMDSRTNKQDLYDNLKIQIADMQSTKTKTISDMEKIRDSYPKNYITVKENLQAKINAKAAELQSQIDKKTAELSNTSSTLSVPLDTTKLNVADTKGYTAMFKIAADKINATEEYQGNPVSATELELWFFIILGVIFEFVAILSAYLAQYESSKHSTIETIEHIPYSPAPDPEKKPIPNEEFSGTNVNSNWKEIQGGRIKGLKFKKLNKAHSQAKANTKTKTNIIQLLSPTLPNKDFTNKELEIYINYMYANTENTANGIEAPGITNTSKAGIGLSYKTCRAIHGHLATTGIITTKNRVTIILKPKSEVSEMLCTGKKAI